MGQTSERMDGDYQRKVSDLVNREVHYCASYLVHTLAGGYGDTKGDLGELCEQAFELSTPIDDWEEPADYFIRAMNRADCVEYLDALSIDCQSDEKIDTLREAVLANAIEEGLQEFCEDRRLDPYQLEIYEHWFVSHWLGHKLADKGEKVDFDFANAIVWGRRTTGQAISIDHVICEIYDDLQKTT